MPSMHELHFPARGVDFTGYAALDHCGVVRLDDAADELVPRRRDRPFSRG
jgi:hypothetical protein